MKHLLTFCFAGATLCRAASPGPPAVTLLSNSPSPQPVGTVIGLMPHMKVPPPPGPPRPPDAPPPPGVERPIFAVRYSVSVNGGPFRIVRDFSQDQVYLWRPELYEHEAKIRLSVRNSLTKQTMDAELPFQITSRAANGEAVVTPTANPLIALFSAPPCSAGSQFRVAFEPKGGNSLLHTPIADCEDGRSNNVYIAGMRADTIYQMRAEVVKGTDTHSGEWLAFHTGMLDGGFPKTHVAVPRDAAASASEGFLLNGVMDPWRLYATDLDGNVVWYTPTPVFPTRMLSGGRFLVQAEAANSSNDMRRLQVLREIDLVGNILRETNVSRVAEQLESRGIASSCKKGGKQCVSGFHHDAIRLPNGHTLVIAGLERMLPPGTQGAKEAVDVLGDIVVDLDDEFQVAWVWNAFDHMDLKRKSLSDAKCKGGRGDDGCPPVFLADEANGWLHANSLSYAQNDGNILLSLPEQNWVLKIDYQNGKGSGKVLWRLGAEGDFKTNSTDPSPWFSYQHDAGFEPPGSDMFSVLDDGHVRHAKDPAAHNRGQVWKLDEAAHTATLMTNADLGVYSVAVGSAQLLQNGNFTFEAGFIDPGPGVYSQAVEVTPQGKIVYAQQINGAMTYRSYRMPDMYTGPDR